MGLIGFKGLFPFMKKNTVGADLKQLKPASFYNVPLKLKGITESEPAVQIGDDVKQGTLLARPSGRFGINIYSPVSGKILNILNKMDSNGEYCKHILIMSNDKNDVEDLPELESISDVNLIARLREAGVVDTISNMPAFLKYAYVGSNSYKNVLILMDSTDPNNSINQTLAEFRTEEVVNGAKYFMNITSAQSVTFVFTETSARLASKVKKHIQESKKNYDFKIKFIPNKYPFDNPYILAKLVCGRTIKETNSFLKEGICIETAEACYNFCRAVEFGKPVTSKVVTVDGTNVSRCGNYIVPNGFSFKNLIDEIGLDEIGERSQLITGNILSGTAQYDTDLSVSLMTDTILIMKVDILNEVKENPCISCGKCKSVCPVSLNPKVLDEAYLNSDFTTLEKNNIFSCIECGCCSYVCPTKRFLTQRIVAGKYYDRQYRNRG